MKLTIIISIRKDTRKRSSPVFKEPL